jgi:hypothetical protein
MENTPGLEAFLYDRVCLHWKSTLMGLCSAAAVVIPVLMANGFNGKYVTLTAALTLAVTTALSKDK